MIASILADGHIDLSTPAGQCAGGGAIVLILAQVVTAILHEYGIEVPVLSRILSRMCNRPNSPAPPLAGT